MNVSFDLFTELIGYRFFIQQRVLDDVAFRIGHHDVVVGNFDIFARLLPSGTMERWLRSNQARL